MSALRLSSPNRSSIVPIALAVLVALSVAMAGVTAAATHAPPPGTDAISVAAIDADDHRAHANPAVLAGVDPTAPPIEAEYVQEVPDEDDPWFEAADRDGAWISYINPRDEYRSPYLGDGSGKICVTLLNENGEVIVGESVPNTSVAIPTGDELEWHTSADPFTVEYPLTEHYERPLDADQFGTKPDLPQGDGYLDSHCLEWHGLPEDETVEYGEAEVQGEYADWIEVVGYIQVENEAWESDVDPLEDAVSYEEAGGGWTYEPDGSHGQAVVVLQLDPPAEAYEDEDEDEDENDTGDEREGEGGDDGDEGNETVAGGDDDSGDDGSDDADELPGFGAPVALVALLIGGLVAAARSRSGR
ncbi:PGF-CTERM sorting domain-containing protein [Natronobeatus ordinarius]|uniref:PGF-CTERM sorting domain-containing protein n=1 Tax=Natronobeatus ordinarius TaxID=2963433 RepID=UPI0020CC285B|nr:PGF-CTERM sorting domain-containing protein [Natronobeatus ordinarius]